MSIQRAPTRQNTERESMSQTDRVKCLIVDDIAENLIAIEALLQRDGIEFLKAHSGPEALELLLDHGDVALALLDVQMPEMNGFELAELIRGSERTRHIPLIFMTAGSREHNWQFRGYESGAVDFLYKPIDPHMLTTKANVFFELHQRKQALAQQLQERTEALRINEMFMAVLSHDLRTPLQSIKAAATVLTRQPDPGKVANMAERMLSSSQRMSRMIEDLLDVTRIRQAEGLPLSPQPADAAAAHAAGGGDGLPGAAPGKRDAGQSGRHLGWRTPVPGADQPAGQCHAPRRSRAAGAGDGRWPPGRSRVHHGAQRRHHSRGTAAHAVQPVSRW